VAGAGGYWNFSHLVGYIVFPSMNWDKGCMTIDERSEALCVVVYSDRVPPVITLSFSELKMLDDYTDISNLSKSDLLKINNQQKVYRSMIEELIRERIKIYIETCREDTYKFCNKWVMRNKFLKAIKEIENNIDQFYTLKTDFYED
jgi:hypothetical protein